MVGVGIIVFMDDVVLLCGGADGGVVSRLAVWCWV